MFFDIPPAVKGAHEQFQTAGLENRIEIMGGDFFQSAPEGGDIYMFKRIIHNWNDEQAVSILKNCRNSMHSNGRILVIEQVIRPGNVPSMGKIADIEMLVMSSGGKERTKKEFQELFSKADLKLNQIIQLKTGSILECTAV